MERDLGELPEVESLANDLDAFFREGKSFPSQEPPPALGEFNLSQEQQALINKYLLGFLTGVFLPQKPMGDIRESVKKLKEEQFPAWKISFLSGLNSSDKDEEKELVNFVQERVTLASVADFAKMIFEAAQKKSGASSPSGDDESEYRRYADYWGCVEQIVRAASEL